MEYIFTPGHAFTSAGTKVSSPVLSDTLISTFLTATRESMSFTMFRAISSCLSFDFAFQIQPNGARRQPPSAFMRAGSTSKRSPTTPRSATPKIGALGSEFTATTTSAPRMPSRCCIAPEMPKQR